MFTKDPVIDAAVSGLCCHLDAVFVYTARWTREPGPHLGQRSVTRIAPHGAARATDGRDSITTGRYTHETNQ